MSRKCLACDGTGRMLAAECPYTPGCDCLALNCLACQGSGVVVDLIPARDVELDEEQVAIFAAAILAEVSA